MDAAKSASRCSRLLPCAPLLAVIERGWEFERSYGARTFPQFTSDCGIGERRVREWRQAVANGVEMGVETWTADAVLCRMGRNWFEVFDPELFPEAYVQAEAVFG